MMKKVKFLDLNKQYLSIKDEIDLALKCVIQNSDFIGGDTLEHFEQNFASYLGEGVYCKGVGNGTDALEIALWALNLPKNSEVIVPANSFIATSEAVSTNRLALKFADCKEDYTICPKSIERLINENTSAIIVVHLYGTPCDMSEILDIAKKHNLKVIEDCAQAHGAKYFNQKVGTFGDIATFSFYPGKNLGAYGDGGAIITKDEKLYLRAKKFANHGRSSKHSYEFEGRNSRLDTLQAAILDVKLKHLDSWLKKREDVANRYLEGLKKLGFILPAVNEHKKSAWHLFVIRSNFRDELLEHLKTNGVECGVHYKEPLIRLRAYKEHLNYSNEYFANKVGDFLLSLPIGEHLEDDDIERVVDVLGRFKQ